MVLGHKVQDSVLDGTPKKRIFWSIINDYDKSTAICELVDNAIDQWQAKRSRKSTPLLIEVNLDVDQQSIEIIDNAGGVPQAHLDTLIAPGGSRNEPLAESIGIFGVGSKRAVVALAEHTEIRSRFSNKETFQIDVTEEWLNDDDWHIPVYSVSNISPRSTQVRLSRLRRAFDHAFEPQLRQHLSETYGLFLKGDLQIKLNGKSIKSTKFNRWAYPPNHHPHRVKLSVNVPDVGIVDVAITCGLILDRDAVSENYGVYFYCNKRLIEKEVRNREVGYHVSTEAGVPHPDASLCRAIVRITGPAKAMPWNSSKSEINFSHEVIQQIRPALIELVSHFTKLSRRLKTRWDEEVFSHRTGTIKSIGKKDALEAKKLRLPDLPKGQTSHVERLLSVNNLKINEQPWTLGLVESIAAVEIINRQHRLQTRNRVSLIVLDSSFEIALKEYVVNNPDIFHPRNFNDKKLRELFENRREVINLIKKHVDVPESTWKKAAHYYLIRNKLIHERATVDVLEKDIENYRKVVSRILKTLFGLKV